MKLPHHFATLGAGLALLVLGGAVQAQTAVSSVRPVAPVSPPPARTSAAPAFGLPSPSGLTSRFPAGLTAEALATPGGGLNGPGSDNPGGSIGGGVGNGGNGGDGGDGDGAGVATRVMGAAGALQPVEFGPGPYTVVDVARSFLLADSNRDGELSRSEARRLTLGNVSFEALDRNHDGIITRWEYEDAMR